MKRSKLIYFLDYTYEYEDGHEDNKVLGAFSSKKNAEKALSKICNHPELKKIKGLKSHFEISESKMERLGWVDGYVTVYY